MGNIADKIKISQDKEGMLRRALERIIQLYTDRSHFVYELLQNAEDANATSVKFVQYPDRLEVLHDGKPFTTKNLEGLCDIGKSDKINDLNQIGEFGVGFKSVFGICDTVKLYSNPSHYRTKDIGDAVSFAIEIMDFTNPQDIDYEELESTYTTKFVFPFTVGRTFSGFKTLSELNTTLAKKLQNLGITTLLFMKSLELIEYQVYSYDDHVIEGQYLLEKNNINDHCSLVSALGLLDNTSVKGGKSEEISYLKFSRQIDEKSKRTVDIAFPVIVSADGKYECQKPDDPYISVYFPTETESKLGFIVQGPYRTTPNRSSIPADEEDNIHLAHETAVLLQDSLLELRDCGKLNMTFLKALPLSLAKFDNYSLFRPLYDVVRNLFVRDSVIPCNSGGYTSADCAKIARQEKLALLFSDDRLTELIHDGEKCRWLPTYLTETNREYEAVYKYLTGDLKIIVIRPEELRAYFAANTEFLPRQTDDWIVELYSVLENIGAAFSKVRNESNMLTANIIKTSNGEFVSAYRRTDNKQYIPNVFLPSEKIHSSDINFVDAQIYARCRHFFDDILQLQKPNEYEFFISTIKKRYSSGYTYDESTHANDVYQLCKYLKYEEYKEEALQIAKEIFALKCDDGKMRNPYVYRVFIPVTQTGINIRDYLKNISNNSYFVDMDYYVTRDISIEMLCTLGVQSSLLNNDKTTTGQYHTGMPGRQPDWWTTGEFRWKLSIDCLKDAVKYISQHPTAKDSIIKSKTIMSILFENESKLMGTVYIGGSTPNKVNEPCEIVHILRGDRTREWDGKWLYTEALELVSPRSVSKSDISTSIYGKIKDTSTLYNTLEFKKTESDQLDELKKAIPQKQLDAFFEDELLKRYGITSADLAQKFGTREQAFSDVEDNIQYSFPVSPVKNWEALKKHAAEMLCFANPVKYDFAVRRIRVSNHPKESRAYLINMYRYDGLYKYACQMCHDSCSNIEVAQIFNKPETELDPMNLCLCPNCANLYRRIRNSTSAMDSFKEKILSLSEKDVSNSEYISIDVENQDIWFTQTHIAEIRELLELEREIGHGQSEPKVKCEENEESGLSVYSSFVGKLIKRKDGFLGKVVKVSDEYLDVNVLKGSNAGKITKIQLSFLAKNRHVYEIVDSDI